MYEWAHFLNVLPAVWGFFNDPSPTGIFCHPCSHRFCRTHPVHRDMELELHWCAGSLLYFPAPWWFCSLENKFSQSQELCWQYLGSSASAWFSSDGCRAVMKFGINVKCELPGRKLPAVNDHSPFFFSFHFLFFLNPGKHWGSLRQLKQRFMGIYRFVSLWLITTCTCFQNCILVP